MFHQVVVRRGRKSTAEIFSAQFPQPSFEKPPFRLLLRKSEGALVSGRASGRFCPAAGTDRPAPRAPGGSPARSPRARMASISARPASGPSRIATATARFSSTTGEGSRPHQHVVQADDLRPVRGRGVGRLGMHRRDRRLEGVGAEPARRQRPLAPAPCLRRSAPGSRASGPGLPAGSDRPSAEVRAARRDSCSSISASSPIASGSGSSSTSRRPSRIASPERSARVSDAPDEAE